MKEIIDANMEEIKQQSIGKMAAKRRNSDSQIVVNHWQRPKLDDLEHYLIEMMFLGHIPFTEEILRPEKSKGYE